MQQVLSALQYLHMNKICGISLTPENILLSTEDNVSNIKLNTLAIVTSGNIQGQEEMPEAYRAPELLHLSTAASAATDSWSLGILLYTLVSGQQLRKEEINAEPSD